MPYHHRYMAAPLLSVYRLCHSVIGMPDTADGNGIGHNIFRQGRSSSPSRKSSSTPPPKDLTFICTDFFDYQEPKKSNYNAIVSLDVIEHISCEMENRYCEIIVDNLMPDGVAIVGTPSVMLNPYASEGSKIGHINLFDQKRLYELMNRYFHNVFIFNMNDEVVNVGFAPMSCYIFAVCCNKR